MLVRYEGCYAATTLTVMGDRDGFVWQPPPSWGRIDDLVAAKWQRMKILPSELCGDHEFLRRITLDLTGLPPTPEAMQAFIHDHRPTQDKRNAIIDRLIGSPEFVDYWTNKWADLLQINSKFLGEAGREDNSATGSAVRWNRIHRTTGSCIRSCRPPVRIMINRRPRITRSFVRPMPSWKTRRICSWLPASTATSATIIRSNDGLRMTTIARVLILPKIALQPDPQHSGDQRIGGTAVEGAKSLYEIVTDVMDGELTPRTDGRSGSTRLPLCRRL